MATANSSLRDNTESSKGLPKALKEVKVIKGEQVFPQKDILVLQWRDEGCAS
jgi:hypothetical protein